MEVKNVIEELKIVKDINELDLNDLANKYLSNEDNYNYFAKNYYNYFNSNFLYQFRAFENYKKIKDLFYYGYLMYPNNEGDQYLGILSTMNYNLDNYNLSTFSEDYGQSISLFMNMVGADKVEKEENYEKLTNNIVAAAEKYEKNNGKSISDFEQYVCCVECNYDYIKTYEAIEKYFRDHPLMYECNDINFLYFANLMLVSHKSSVSNEFVNDVKEVIKASEVIRKYNSLLIDSQRKKDYKRVAKYTLHNIKKWEKEDKLFNGDRKTIKK